MSQVAHWEDLALDSDPLDEFARDVHQGLESGRKSLPSKYIYDEQGSHLFAQITQLPEYYLTRCETRILEKYKEALLGRLNETAFHLIELGAGDGRKTKILLSHLANSHRQVCYIPIDISRSPLENLIDSLHQELGGIHSRALVMDYFEGLRYLSSLNGTPKLVLFLGSSIGNMNARASDHFLSRLRAALNPNDYLLIGFDLKKNIQRLLRAYNDAQGITAAFNKNLLHRINRELGGAFIPDRFEFYSTYEASGGAVQSYLVSTCFQQVYIQKLHRHYTFKSWEAIHTESSYKYDLDQIGAMASINGYEIIANYTDERAFFVDSLWRAV
jgi:dimethylhistidine N-methyltransferase